MPVGTMLAGVALADLSALCQAGLTATLDPQIGNTSTSHFPGDVTSANTLAIAHARPKSSSSSSA